MLFLIFKDEEVNKFLLWYPIKNNLPICSAVNLEGCGGKHMIVTVDRTNLLQAAKIHSISWKESHRSFCAPDFMEVYLCLYHFGKRKNQYQ